MRCLITTLIGAFSLSLAREVPEYNETLGRIMLQYARVSFCDRDAIEKWTCGDACAATEVVPGTVFVFGPGVESGVRGYVAQVPGPAGHVQCLVGFRGSVNANNWVTDALLVLVDWPTANSTNYGASWCRDCQVHSGFALAFDELAEGMYRSLRGLQCDSTYVAGHSLGAAVATVAAMDIRGSDMQVDMLWTFGSPRVGDTTFVKAYVALADRQHVDPPEWRVVHYDDPVPNGGPMTFYTHIPVQVWYSNRASSAYQVCPWHAGNLSDEGTCGIGTLGVVDLTSGLLHNDHVTYMNLTFAMKDMEPECRRVNWCTQTAGMFSRTFLILAFIFGSLFGAILMYQNQKKLWCTYLVAKQVSAADDGITQAYEVPFVAAE